MKEGYTPLMKKFFFIAFLILLSGAVLISGRQAAAKVYVDIESPSFKLIPIAVCDFIDKQEAPGTGVSEGIKQDLALTGIFNILNKKSFLEEKNPATESNAEKINFSDWAAIGADYLVRGNVAQNNKEITATCHLYDIASGELIFHKKYHAAPDNEKIISRDIASDIMRALINDEGDFNTQVAFVSKKGLKSDIHSIDYDGSNPKIITNHQSIVLVPRWSPDGNYLAFTSFKRGRPDIYIMNVNTKTEKRIVSYDGLNLCGSFSPDGKKLLMTLSKDGNEEIYSMDIETLTLKRLTRNWSIDVSPSWSPDGGKIVFVSNRSGSPQIYTMDADGGNVKRITFDGTYNTSPSWSPRGNRIVYEGLTGNKYQIFSIGDDGNNPQQLTSDSTDKESPSWSPSGRQIVYVSHKYPKSKIFIMNSNGSNPRLLYDQSHKLIMPSWSPRLKK